MIYSRWRPDKGGFDYFENSERRGFGDDLPIPRSGFSMSPIGTASVSIGRNPPGRLRKVGSGPDARGMVMSASSSGLRGLPLVDRLGTAVVVAGAFVAGVLLSHWDSKRRR
jgi:hypothetical protein